MFWYCWDGAHALADAQHDGSHVDEELHVVAPERQTFPALTAVCFRNSCVKKMFMSTYSCKPPKILSINSVFTL